jgi:hypothetical protein
LLPHLSQECGEKSAMDMMDLSGDHRVSQDEFLKFCQVHGNLPGTLLQQGKEREAKSKLAKLRLTMRWNGLGADPATV